MERKKKALSSVPFLILMDMVLLFTFQGLDSILASSWGFVLATWQLRKSPNMHILILCEFWGFFSPPFVSIVYLYGAKEHAGKKARCEPASLWQLVSRLLRRKASKVTAQDVRKKLFRTKKQTNRENHGNCLGINYQSGHLQQFAFCQNFS